MLSTALYDLASAFQYEFMRNALITGSFFAISCALIGVFLVLRKFSLIGDGLAHVSLATVALGLVLGIAPIMVSIPAIIIAAFLILKLSEKANMWGDSAIGFVSSVSVALAVIITSVSGGYNNDLYNYLFGSINDITPLEMWLAIGLSITTVSLIILNYHDLFAMTFDEKFAQVNGIKTERINVLLVILTGITVVLGVRIVGTMLVSSMIVIPAISALQVAKGFKSTLFFAAVFSLTSVVVGIALAYLLNLPSGATIVMVNAFIFMTTFFGRRVIE